MLNARGREKMYSDQSQVIDKKHINTKNITWLVMWMTTLGQAAISLYLPAFPQIAQALNFHESILKISITMFLIGFGVSQLIYGPLSDRYGRKPVLLFGIALFSWGCLLILFSRHSLGFLLSRLLQGMGCGATITLGRSILRDCFSGRELASAASYLSMGFAVSFGISPVIGVYLQEYFNWQYDFIFLAVASGFLFWVFWQYLPETNLNIYSENRSKFSIKLLMNEYKQIISNRIFLKFLLGGVCAYGTVVAYNVMTPFLVQNVLGYSANTYGWSTVCVAAAYFAGAFFNRGLVLKFEKKMLFISGSLLILFAGLMLLFFSGFSHQHLFMILMPMMLATFGQSLIFSNTIASALQNFEGALSSRASATFSGLQLLLVGLLSFLFGIPSGNSAIPLAIVLLGLGIACSLLLYKRS